MLETLGQSPTASSLQDMMAEADIDGDGGVTLAEMLKILPPLTDAALVRADGRRMGRVGTISELIRHVFRRPAVRYAPAIFRFPPPRHDFPPSLRACAARLGLSLSRAL